MENLEHVPFRLPGYDACHMRSMAYVVTGVRVGDFWSVWPFTVSNEVSTASDLEARPKPTTQLTGISLGTSHIDKQGYIPQGVDSPFQYRRLRL